MDGVRTRGLILDGFACARVKIRDSTTNVRMPAVPCGDHSTHSLVQGSPSPILMVITSPMELCFWSPPLYLVQVDSKSKLQVEQQRPRLSATRVRRPRPK